MRFALPFRRAEGGFHTMPWAAYDDRLPAFVTATCFRLFHDTGPNPTVLVDCLRRRLAALFASSIATLPLRRCISQSLRQQRHCQCSWTGLLLGPSAQYLMRDLYYGCSSLGRVFGVTPPLPAALRMNWRLQQGAGKKNSKRIMCRISAYSIGLGFSNSRSRLLSYLHGAV